jgi:S1-C subfamily serine protease
VRRSELGAAAFALLLFSGCASTVSSIACDVETPSRRGRGVIVGPKTILTVGHVVDGAEQVTVDSRPARVVARHVRATETGPDGLVVLELITGEFPRERIATLADHPNAGIKYLPARGEHPWPWGLEPGDSGSPILDSQGRVTGLVRAVYGRAEPLDQATVDSFVPRPGDS